MRGVVPAKQRVHRILRGLRCYLSPALRLGRPFPKGVAISPGEEFLGAIVGSKGTRLESVLTDRGAFLRSRAGWQFVPYGDVEDVCFPEKEDLDGSLTLRTSDVTFQLMRRDGDLWGVGRFFMRCADDANGV